MPTKSPTLLALFFFLLLVSCGEGAIISSSVLDENDGLFSYSGSFKSIQTPFIQIGREQFENDLTYSPIQIVAEVQSDNLIFFI